MFALPLAFVWPKYDLFWPMFGLRLTYVWPTIGLCLVYVWPILGLSMLTLCLFGLCLAYFGLFLAYVWSVFGLCLVCVWPMLILHQIVQVFYVNFYQQLLSFICSQNCMVTFISSCCYIYVVLYIHILF